MPAQAQPQQSCLRERTSVTCSPHQIACFAHRLTLRRAADSMQRMVGALLDARADLNPYQVDTALFATSNPLSKGVILADEVGLGKTIEAGLSLAQRWAEPRRRLLGIVPANLRKQSRRARNPVALAGGYPYSIDLWVETAMSRTDLLAAATQSFESLKQNNEHGAEFWSARDLQPLLGYSQWRRFEQAVDRAKTSCATSGNNPEHHFAGAGKPIVGRIGSPRCVA